MARDVKLPALPEGALFYTPEDLAQWLKVNVQTIRNWARDGSLRAHKFGDLWRFSPENVELFVRSAYDSADAQIEQTRKTPTTIKALAAKRGPGRPRKVV